MQLVFELDDYIIWRNSDGTPDEIEIVGFSVYAIKYGSIRIMIPLSDDTNKFIRMKFGKELEDMAIADEKSKIETAIKAKEQKDREGISTKKEWRTGNEGFYEVKPVWQR